MRHSTLGVFAHVDAGKTTLCEAILYKTGVIRHLGRIDNRDSLFDSHSIERARGITVFSKESTFSLGDMSITLLDTPGHVDFVSEAERTMPVLDLAVLIISGTDGVQPHGKTLWTLLRKYRVPTVLFVTKMDLSLRPEDDLFQELQREFGDGCFTADSGLLSGKVSDKTAEELSLVSEEMMEEYLETGTVSRETIVNGFRKCRSFPVLFGSGLKTDGVDVLLETVKLFAPEKAYGDEFSARVYKVTHDEKNQRVTHVKITGGSLGVRTVLTYRDGKGDTHEEKINGIRLYNGDKYTLLEKAEAGEVVGITGLSATFAGQGLGSVLGVTAPLSEPVFSYTIVPEDDVDVLWLYKQIRILEEEDPMLRFSFSEKFGTISISLMGAVQTEVIESIIASRFGVNVRIEQGRILYKETIKNKVEGVGHYEPLRHYAEVHVLLEPLKPGSGIVLHSACPGDELSLTWQRQILYNLEEKKHVGVLGGFPLTDVRITLVSGKAHLKHTEGGDMRQAALRAVRQGLMQAENVLLEPVYNYEIKLPSENLGRAINDIQNMSGTFEVETLDDGMSVLRGKCPVLGMHGYSDELASYTGGSGTISCEYGGYMPCHDQDEIVKTFGYDPEADLGNSPDSVFCKHGAGFVVKWNEVFDYMHLDSFLRPRPAGPAQERHRTEDLDEKEIEAIMNREFGPIRRKQYGASAVINVKKGKEKKEEVKKRHIVIDGYNLMFAWEEAKELSQKSLDLARTKLMDAMSDYHGFTGDDILIVFDAYRNTDQTEKRIIYHGIEVLYTNTDQTADAYIERFANELSRNESVKVVSSDNLVRLGVFRSGISAISSKYFLEEMKRVEGEIRSIIGALNIPAGQRLGDIMDQEELEQWRRKLNLSEE